MDCVRTAILPKALYNLPVSHTFTQSHTSVEAETPRKMLAEPSRAIVGQCLAQGHFDFDFDYFGQKAGD